MNNDLISRSALLRETALITEHFSDEIDAITIEHAIRTAPAVDAEPTRHGKWGDYQINGYDGLHPIYEVPCRLCNKYARFKYRFCPHCGAKMDGGTDGDNKQ